MFFLQIISMNKGYFLTRNKFRAEYIVEIIAL
jgi:hypothetical protein